MSNRVIMTYICACSRLFDDGCAGVFAGCTMSTVAGYNGVGVKEGMPRFLVAARDDDSMRVIEALKQLYRKKLRPTEEMFSFGSFHYDVITDTELDAKSQVLVIGQYSTGKTTFIRHLLGADFPNMNIGPEPTTDKFTVVMHGEQDLPVEGNSLALIKELPYEGLTRFGTGFLNKLDAAISTSPFLKNITLVDTPGVLSGEMQRRQRAYNFADVARWFADRSDMILILFDAHRLDVSDELMEILMRLVDHQYKIRIVLNKADQVDKATLRRVYGALMWSMGKVFDNPEVVRVYLGSFWEKPLKHRAHQKLFQADQNALTEELVDLPRLSAVRKVNQFIKRTKMVRAHACVLSYLCEQMPWMYGKLKRREELLNNLEGVLETVRVKHGLHEADMPEPEALRAKLHGFDFSEFPILTPAILRQLNNVVDVDVHKVLREGGGSAKFFKFSRNETPSARPGWISRAGMSMRDLFVGGSTTSSPPPAVASSRSSPAREHSSIPRAAVTPRPTTSSVTSAKQGGGMPSSVVESASGELDRSEEGSGMLSGAREKMASSTQRRGQERGRLQKKRTGWSYCGILQFLFVLCAGVILLLLALEPFMRSAGEGPLHSAAKAVRQKAERHLPQDTVRRLLSRGFGDWKGQQSGEPARDSSDEDESTSSDEVRALYKGMIH